jgi:Rrf2 family protein
VRVTARLSYGLDALIDLASADEPVKGDVLAARHGVSVGFLENILAELRRGGVVHSKRGGRGGYWLARPPDEITVADVIRTLDGARAFEASTAPGRLTPVWEAISRASFDAAEAITLSAVAKEEAKEETGQP